MAMTISEAQVVLHLVGHVAGTDVRRGESLDGLADDANWLASRAQKVLAAGRVPALDDIHDGLQQLTTEQAR